MQRLNSAKLIRMRGFLAVLVSLWGIGLSNAQVIDKFTESFDFRSVQSGEQDRPVSKDSLSSVRAEESATTNVANRNRVAPRFTNGTPTDRFQRVVRIQFLNKFGITDTCSGLLLRPRELSESLVTNLVLTAAHCSCGRLDSYRINVRKPNTPLNDVRYAEYVPAAPPSRYANYACELPARLQPGRDLAMFSVVLLGRDEPIGIGEILDSKPTPSGILVGRMQDVFTDVATRRLVGVGFGYDENQQLPDSKPLEASVPIASYFCGRGRYAASLCAPFREFVLADRSAPSGASRSDSCGGDSGAPIFWQSPPSGLGSKPLITLVGVTSRALEGVIHNQGTTCGGGGIYTSTGHPDVIAWLRGFGLVPLTPMQLNTVEASQ